MSNEKYDTAAAGLTLAAIDGAQMMIESLRKDRDYLSHKLDAARQEIASLTAQHEGGKSEALADLAYAHGMTTGWNLCIADKHDEFARIRSMRSSQAISTIVAPQPTPQPLHVAATSCPHEIDKDKIVLHFDSKQPGKNALAQLAARLQASGAPRDTSITLDFRMATELLKMFGEEPGLVTLQQGSERSQSGTGLYAWYPDLPDEGAEFLGAEPDDEAVPEAAPAQPVAHVSQETFNDDGTSDIIIPALPIGMALYAAPQPAAQALDSARVFWQQHTKSDALSMTMAELHTDVELVIRAARGSSQAAPVDAAVQQDAERLDFMIESCTQVATISPSGRKYLCYPDGRMQAGSYPTARAAIDAAAQKGTND